MKSKACDATRVVTTRTSKNWLGDDGILRTEMLPNSAETLADAHANIDACVELSGGLKRPICVDFRSVRSQDRAARIYYGGPEAERVLTAAALVTGSALTRVIANFYVAFNRTRFPTRMFTSEEDAIAWLKGFVS